MSDKIYNKNLLDPDLELADIAREDILIQLEKRVKQLTKEKAGPGDEYDYEGYMIKTQLRRMREQAVELLSMIEDDEQFPAWMQSKVTLASEYMDSVYDFYKYSDYNITSEKPEDNDEDDDSPEGEMINILIPMED